MHPRLRPSTTRTIRRTVSSVEKERSLTLHIDFFCRLTRGCRKIRTLAMGLQAKQSSSHAVSECGADCMMFWSSAARSTASHCHKHQWCPCIGLAPKIPVSKTRASKKGNEFWQFWQFLQQHMISNVYMVWFKDLRTSTLPPASAYSLLWCPALFLQQGKHWAIQYCSSRGHANCSYNLIMAQGELHSKLTALPIYMTNCTVTINDY